MTSCDVRGGCGSRSSVKRDWLTAAIARS
jgi:hypothetical protein